MTSVGDVERFTDLEDKSISFLFFDSIRRDWTPLVYGRLWKCLFHWLIQTGNPIDVDF